MLDLADLVSLEPGRVQDGFLEHRLSGAVGHHVEPEAVGAVLGHPVLVGAEQYRSSPYRQDKHVLFGQQEGLCNGCKGDFPFKLFEVDHSVPRSRGGTDHLDNLQLLCSSCNRIKGDRPHEYMVARLAEIGV